MSESHTDRMNSLEGVLREELFELSVTDSAAFCSAGLKKFCILDNVK